jgi:hypothetical protein
LRDAPTKPAAVNTFTATHATTLTLTTETVAIANKDAVEAALTAYNALSAPAKAQLPADTGTKLQALLDKIAQLEAAAANTFTAAHAAALALTMGTVVITNKDAVNNALTAYNALSAAVKALLAGEKALLDNLAAKIAQLYPEHELTFLEKTVIVEDRTGGLMNPADLDKIQEAFTQKEAELLQMEAEGNAMAIGICRAVLDRGFRIIVDNSGYTNSKVVDWSTLSASNEYFQRYPNVKDALYSMIVNGLYPMPVPGTGE